MLQVRSALEAAGLETGAICMRYPDEMRLGAFTNPDETLRRKAVELTKGGCRWAQELGANELIVWSPYDGYDYNLQVRHGVCVFRKLL